MSPKEELVKERGEMRPKRQTSLLTLEVEL
jgi:hypothetical protein